MTELTHAVGSFRPVPRSKLSHAAAAQLERLIKDGTFRPGDRLPPERVLSEQLGVGRSSMREALRTLEARGLVRITHGVGVHVSDSSATTDLASLLLLEGGSTVPELFEVRYALECTAAASAARRITAAEAGNLRQILEAMSDDTLSDEGYVEKDAELHMAVVRATHNPLLIQVYAMTQPLFVEYSGRVITFPDRRRTSLRDHAAIVNAVTRRRPQVAQKLMRAHLRAAEEQIFSLQEAEQLRAASAGDD